MQPVTFAWRNAIAACAAWTFIYILSKNQPNMTIIFLAVASGCEAVVLLPW